MAAPDCSQVPAPQLLGDLSAGSSAIENPEPFESVCIAAALMVPTTV